MILDGCDVSYSWQVDTTTAAILECPVPRKGERWQQGLLLFHTLPATIQPDIISFNAEARTCLEMCSKIRVWRFRKCFGCAQDLWVAQSAHFDKEHVISRPQQVDFGGHPVGWVEWYGVAKLEGEFPSTSISGLGFNSLVRVFLGPQKTVLIPLLKAIMMWDDPGIPYSNHWNRTCPVSCCSDLWRNTFLDCKRHGCFSLFFTQKDDLRCRSSNCFFNMLPVLLHRCYTQAIHVTWSMNIWLLVWNVFPYFGNFIMRTDELIFFRGLETTNQIYTWDFHGFSPTKTIHFGVPPWLWKPLNSSKSPPGSSTDATRLRPWVAAKRASAGVKHCSSSGGCHRRHGAS